MKPSEGLADVKPEEPEAADSLHCSPIDGDRCISSLSFPVFHNQLLCFADVRMEVVFLTPGCQGSDPLSLPAEIRPMTVVLSAN